jgi:plastocyanin
MNKNLLIGLVVIILVIGGLVVIQSNSGNETETSIADIQETTDSSDAMEESGSMESDDSMLANSENVVTLTGEGFSPQTITISVGDEVVWVNESGDRATVDSSVHPTHRDYTPLNLGVFEVGEQHNLVFDEPGTYRYHDHLNASRFGTVVVE